MRLSLDDVATLLERGYAVTALAIKHGDDQYSLSADGEAVIRVYPVGTAFASEIVAPRVHTIAEAHAAILTRIAELEATRAVPPPACTCPIAARSAACASEVRS